MSVLVEPLGRERAGRIYADVAGYASGFHEWFDGQQATVLLRSVNGGASYRIPTDRNFFFARRVRQDRYDVLCDASFAGMATQVFCGSVVIGPGKFGLRVDLSGGSICGRVSGIRVKHETQSRLVLRRKGAPREQHSALLSAHGAFHFSGLRPGVYGLRGEVPGQGDILVTRIELEHGERRDLGSLDIRVAPYLRFEFSTPRGRPLLGRTEVWISRPGAGWTRLRCTRFRQGALLVARNTFRGLSAYRAQRRGFACADGVLRLNRDEHAVAVSMRRLRSGDESATGPGESEAERYLVHTPCDDGGLDALHFENGSAPDT